MTRLGSCSLSITWRCVCIFVSVLSSAGHGGQSVLLVDAYASVMHWLGFHVSMFRGAVDG